MNRSPSIRDTTSVVPLVLPQQATQVADVTFIEHHRRAQLDLHNRQRQQPPASIQGKEQQVYQRVKQLEKPYALDSPDFVTFVREYIAMDPRLDYCALTQAIVEQMPVVHFVANQLCLRLSAGNIVCPFGSWFARELNNFLTQEIDRTMICQEDNVRWVVLEFAARIRGTIQTMFAERHNTLSPSLPPKNHVHYSVVPITPQQETMNMRRLERVFAAPSVEERRRIQEKLGAHLPVHRE